MAEGIKGTEGLSDSELMEHINRGGKFVVFSYAMSFLVVSLKRSSAVHFVKADENAFVKSLPYTVLSLLLGWWVSPGASSTRRGPSCRTSAAALT